MAEIKNSFVASKMNKDVDDRLVPNNEYRDARNISIGKTEEGNDGSVQNSLGNKILDFDGLETDPTLKCIGQYSDNQSNRIYQFLTNYTDVSPTLDTPPTPGMYTMKIVVRDFALNTYTTLVQGDFLNFATNNAFKIYGINVVENLLFWTDNRNQPRKINISSALNNHANSLSPYYTKDYQISVAKYAPLTPISLYTKITAPVAVAINTTSFKVLKTYKIVPGMTIISATPQGLPIIAGSEYILVDSVVADTDPLYNVITVYLPPISPTAFNTGKVLDFLISTMSDQSNSLTWPGDPEYMKGRYIRFSYRFKYDDNEYSLMAPFTQIAYVPLQKGYFINGNEVDAYRSTILKWMQNNINNVDLLIEFPDLVNNIRNSYKIKEIDILYKESDALAIRVLDTIDNATMTLNSVKNIYTYRYQSRKPYRVLPDNQITRVYDKVPLRARAQEVAGNRVIYGNFVDRQTPPLNLNYTIAINKKSDSFPNFIEYPNHTLKQKRNYQVGFVLADKYGRDSSVILSSILDTTSPSGDIIFGGSTIFSDYPSQSKPIQVKEWFGNTLVLQLNSVISSTKNNSTGTPGLYAETLGTGFVLKNLSTTTITDNIDGTSTYVFTLNNGTAPVANSYLRGAYIDYVKVITANSSGTIPNQVWTVITEGRVNDIYLKTVDVPDTKYSYKINPLGWYSYKIVVRQKEQDYYNVYLPGMLNGYPISQTYGAQTVYSTSTSSQSISKQGHGTVGSTTIDLDGLNTVNGILVGDFVSGGGIVPNTFTVVSINTSTSITLSNPLTASIPLATTLYFYRNGVPIGTPVLQNGINATIFPLNETNEIAHVVLFNDNINKIPKDLIEVGPDQKQYRSSVELFGRVENFVDNKFCTSDPITSDPLLQEFYYDSSVLTNRVILNATGGDLLLLYDDIARTTLHAGWDPTTKVLVNEPAPALGANIWKITFTPQAPAGINQGPAPLYFAVVLPENHQFYPSKKPDIVSSISTALDFNFLETTVENPSGSASANIYQLQSNPNIGRIATSLSIGVSGEYMIPFLSVYETKPVISALDLFWETATTGYISDINADVLNGFDGPVSFDDTNFLMFECQCKDGTSLVAGDCNSKYITTTFNPINSSEQVISSVDCVLDPTTPLTVVDNLGNIRTPQFKVEVQYSGLTIIGYRLVIDSSFVFNFDGNARESYVFTLNFNWTDPVTGITAPYPLTINGFCGNNNPTIDPATPITYNITQQDTLVHTFTGVSGGLMSGCLPSTDTSSLQWSITGNDIAGNFSINPVTGVLTNINPEIPGNCYSIRVTLTDAYNFTNNTPTTGPSAVQGSLTDFIDITVCVGLQRLNDGIANYCTYKDPVCHNPSTPGTPNFLLNNFNGSTTSPCHSNGNGTTENAYPYKYGVIYIGKDDVTLNSAGHPATPGVTLPTYPLPTTGTSNVYQAAVNVQSANTQWRYLVGHVPPCDYSPNVNSLFPTGAPSGITQGGALFKVTIYGGYGVTNYPGAPGCTTWSQCCGKVQEAKLDMILYHRDISTVSPNPNPWVADTDATETLTAAFSDGVDGQLYIKGNGQTAGCTTETCKVQVSRTVNFEVHKFGEWALVLRLKDNSDPTQCCPGAKAIVCIDDAYFKEECVTEEIGPDENGSYYPSTTCDIVERWSSYTTQLWQNTGTPAAEGYPTSIPYTTQALQTYPINSANFTVIANPPGYGIGFVNLSLPSGGTLPEQVIPGLRIFVNNVDSGKNISQIFVSQTYPGLIQTGLTSLLTVGQTVKFQFAADTIAPITPAPVPGPNATFTYPYRIWTNGESYTSGIQLSISDGTALDWEPSGFRAVEIGNRYYNYWGTTNLYNNTAMGLLPIVTSELMTTLTRYPTYIAKVDNSGNILPADPGQKRIATGWGAAMSPTPITLSLHGLNVGQNVPISPGGYVF
jgi:hypothetical protein